MSNPSTLVVDAPLAGGSFLSQAPDIARVLSGLADLASESPAAGLEVMTAERHRLDDAIEAALDAWQANPLDQRTEGAVVRDVLVRNAQLVEVWLVDEALRS